MRTYMLNNNHCREDTPMSNKTRNLISHRLIITTAASALLSIGAISSGVHATPGITQPDAESLILADTSGMDRRQDNRDGRQDNRGDRSDTRQDCRGEEGVGKDKRDCKQEGRQEPSKNDKG